MHLSFYFKNVSIKVRCLFTAWLWYPRCPTDSSICPSEPSTVIIICTYFLVNIFFQLSVFYELYLFFFFSFFFYQCCMKYPEVILPIQMCLISIVLRYQKNKYKFTNYLFFFFFYMYAFIIYYVSMNMEILKYIFTYFQFLSKST